ncbi:MAG TPA: iron dependent repressor, metal binding and dimerization domain protein [Candidatus Nanoarchaeia archaeon]|nr:iron dependent repressor, metal binding and dimerization domain protein [Candidatus Nanoarchaeia archaeon]
MKKATYLLKVHRLWETYLVEKANISTEHVHDFAHKYEHITPVSVAEEMNKTLKHPRKDPHGHRIPR